MRLALRSIEKTDLTLNKKLKPERCDLCELDVSVKPDMKARRVRVLVMIDIYRNLTQLADIAPSVLRLRASLVSALLMSRQRRWVRALSKSSRSAQFLSIDGKRRDRKNSIYGVNNESRQRKTPFQATMKSTGLVSRVIGSETSKAMNYRTALRTLAVLMTMASKVFAAPAPDQSVEQFYRGKAVTLLVSADAGTPTDIIARQFARFFVKYMPGHPQAIVMNVIGAGGMVAAASLESRQPHDGTVIGFLQRNNLYIPLLDPRQSRFDPRKVRWLGSLNKVDYCMVAMTRSGVNTADDLFKKQMFSGATGFSNEDRTLPALLNQYLGTKIRIVPGYTGRGEVYLAMQRGEVDGWASTVDGLKQGDPVRLLANGKLKVLLDFGWKSPPEFPNVPNLSTYITKPEDKAVFNLFLLPFEAGRPIAVPDGVPEDRMDALRVAFAKTIADPEFDAAMKSAGYPVDAIDGGAVEKIVNELYATPEPQLESARKLIFSPE